MRMPQQLCCLKCSNMKVSGQFIAFRKVTHRVWPFELTVGLCSGFFLSMLLINCFLQSKFHPILVVEFSLLYVYACRLNHFVSYILSACRKKKNPKIHLQCRRIHNWKWWHNWSFYFVNKSSHILFHKIGNTLIYLFGSNWKI